MHRGDSNTYGWVKDVLTFIGGLVLVGFVGLIIMFCWTTVTWGHSFYPSHCCHDQDCEPIAKGRIENVAGGYLIDGLLYVPERGAKTSPDGDYHGCFPGNKTSVRCFWRPPMSM